MFLFSFISSVVSIKSVDSSVDLSDGLSWMAINRAAVYLYKIQYRHLFLLNLPWGTYPIQLFQKNASHERIRNLMHRGNINNINLDTWHLSCFYLEDDYSRKQNMAIGQRVKWNKIVILFFTMTTKITSTLSASIFFHICVSAQYISVLFLPDFAMLSEDYNTQHSTFFNIFVSKVWIVWNHCFVASLEPYGCI